ncbi:MAG: hypothetical protein EOO75_04225 [Myxococcales bacterium]|nr:MAG: hypothetical protein EOO75_04225 [Myxococcales bacterium]
MRVALLTLGLLLAACSKNNDTPKAEPAGRGAPPPPADSAAAKPGACKGGGGEVTDPVSAPFLPRTVGSLCVNPEGTVRAFGDKASEPIKGICQLFDGGCEVYITHQVKRTVSLDYVDGQGTGSTVTTVLSQFASSEHAYAMYTHRVTSGEDPTRADMPKAIDVGAPGAQGTGSLYAVKGPYLLELSYVNTEESGDEKRMKASAEKALPPLARAIVAKLPGAAAPPAAVGLLPADKQLPLGVSYELGKVLGLEGTGNGAVGFYRDGAQRYRVLTISKDDPEQAKDVLKTVARAKGAQEEKNVGEAATRVMLQAEADDPKTEWVVARKGKVVVGIGDDAFALRDKADAAKVTLPRDEKIKRLKAVLDGLK